MVPLRALVPGFRCESVCVCDSLACSCRNVPVRVCVIAATCLPSPPPKAQPQQSPRGPRPASGVSIPRDRGPPAYLLLTDSRVDSGLPVSFRAVQPVPGVIMSGWALV